MTYTAKYNVLVNRTDRPEVVTTEYTYEDVPYSINKVYHQLIDRLKGVTDHYLYTANDKQIIDINNRVTIKLKEYNDTFAGTSGYMVISLKNVSPQLVHSPCMRIPRDEFELYTLVSLIQNIIDATSLNTNINLLNNTYKIYYANNDYNKFSVFIKGVVFDTVKEDKKYKCSARINNLEIVSIFDDLADYRAVAQNLYNKLLQDELVCDILLSMFQPLVFIITKEVSCTSYTFMHNEKTLMEITYVGLYNVNIKLFGSISYTTTLDKCSEILKTMLTDLTADTNLLKLSVNMK